MEQLEEIWQKRFLSDQLLEEILSTTEGVTPHVSNPELYHKDDVLKLMKRTYNMAIDKAAENAAIGTESVDCMDTYKVVDKDSILKLKLY